MLDPEQVAGAEGHRRASSGSLSPADYGAADCGASRWRARPWQAPGADMVVLPHLRHAILIRAADTVAPLVRRFLLKRAA
jgi:hypothetical protein